MSPRHRQPAFFAALLSAVILAVAATQYAASIVQQGNDLIFNPAQGGSIILDNVDGGARLTALEGRVATMATQLSSTQMQLSATQANLNATQADLNSTQSQLSAAIVRISVLET